MSCMRAGEVVVSDDIRERAPRTVRDVADRGKVHFAREQRREPTPGEEILWHALRDSKLGMKFRRQHPMKSFVLDFYCAELRIAIELDGASHEGREDYDQWRDAVLRSWGIRVLRFEEKRVREDLSAMLKEIRVVIENA
jgi:very-short-patch-repair endonuclease